MRGRRPGGGDLGEARRCRIRKSQGGRWVWHDVDKGSEMAAQVAHGGDCSPADGELSGGPIGACPHDRAGV